MSKSEGIILNAHHVAVSVVNNDASVHVYCQLGSQVVVKYDHMYVYRVGLDTMYLLWCHVCNKFLFIENHS